MSAQSSDKNAAARKNRRLVFAALEDYYDDVKQTYRSGHSDETVSKELGLAEAFICSIREENFGPLRPPTEIQMLLEEAAKIQKDLSAVKKRLDDMITIQGWKL